MVKTLKQISNGTAVIATLVLAQTAFAMGGEYGKSDPKRPLSLPSWAEGVSVLANRSDRIGGRWLNGSSWFQYRGEAQAFNDFMKHYAQVKQTPLTLYLGDPKEMLIVSTAKASPDYDWEMSLTGWSSTRVSVTLPLNNSILLHNLKIPANIAVETFAPKTPEIKAFLAKHKHQYDQFHRKNKLIAQTPQQREEIKQFLLEWKKSNLIESSAFMTLKAKYGDKTLPLLADFLADKELGFHAQSAMDQIDSVGATPYKLKNLAHSDPNQQNATFRIANNALKEYEWHLRAGQPAEDTTKPKPPYAPNTKPYPFRKELHAAAVVELTTVIADKPIGAEREAIETLGLTGTKKDIPLLKRYAAKYGANPFLVAALTRLGDRASFLQIEEALKQPAKTKPEEAWSRENGRIHPARPGVLVTERESGDRLRVAMEQAAYTMNRRFIPLLLAHLDDPNGQQHGDYSDPSPAYHAQEALSKIVFGKFSVAWTKELWKEWAAKHPKMAAGQ